MATYNYLYLVNRLCHKLNEVELDSSNFASAGGVYTDFMESVNAAILDIYQEEDNVWPFAYVSTTFDTTIGTNSYPINAAAEAVNWDSFYIKKQSRTPSSITTSGTTATVTDAGHPHQTGDNIYVSGATQTGYNGYVTITVLSSSQFTYTVPSGTASPATGTILIYPQYTTQFLRCIDYDAYLEERYVEIDGESIMVGQYSKPAIVVRKTDNSIILTGVPDRIYTVAYDYFTSPADLVNWNDVPTIPAQFRQCIVDGAMYHAYMFRDNIEEAGEAKNKYTDGVNRMRRILIPQPEFMRIDSSLNYEVR